MTAPEAVGARAGAGPRRPVPDRQRDAARAFEACFGRTYPEIARFCARRLASAHDAEEAATEVYAIAWRRRAELPDAPEDRLWLFAVARNVVANMLRSERRRERLLARLTDEAVTGATAVPPPAADGRVMAEALAALRPADRELLLLAAWEGLAVSELAVVLGRPAPVVSRRLHRARRKLADRLGQAGGRSAAGRT